MCLFLLCSLVTAWPTKIFTHCLSTFPPSGQLVACSWRKKTTVFTIFLSPTYFSRVYLLFSHAMFLPCNSLGSKNRLTRSKPINGSWAAQPVNQKLEYSALIGLFKRACRTPAKFEFSLYGKEVLRHSMASSLESSISFSTLFRRILTLPFFKFCCFQFLCTEYGTVWGITQWCSICILFAPS